MNLAELEELQLPERNEFTILCHSFQPVGDFIPVCGCFETSARFVDYKIELKSLLPSHKSDSYQNKSGGKKTPPSRAEFYLRILKYLKHSPVSRVFLHFAHVLKCRLCFITV